MIKKIINFCKNLVVVLLAATIVYSAIFHLSNVMAEDLPEPVWNNLPFPTYMTPNSAFSYNSGAVQFNMQYSDLFGYVLNGKIIGALGERNAGALELDYGNNEGRVNGTWGFLITPKQLIKLTGEYLTQNLEFDFDSGAVKRWIPQYAVGGEYKYLFARADRMKGIEVGGYYADAQSKFLPTIIYISQGGEYINYRHISGAISDGANLGLDVQPWKTNLINLKLNYDHVHYGQFYYLKDTNRDDQGIGYTVNIQQLLSRNIMLQGSASQRDIYDDYTAGVSYLVPMPYGNRLELGFSAEHVKTHNSTPDDTSYFLKATYSWNGSEQNLNHYSLPLAAENNNLINWVETPAVHMERVLATVDQLTKKIAVVLSSISPASGSTSGGTLVTLSGAGFVPGATVLFGEPAESKLLGAAATNVVVVNDHTITATTPAHPIGFVNVTVRDPDGSASTLPNGYEYTDIPHPTSISPTVGTTAGGTSFTISGSSFTGTTSVTFGGTPASFTVTNDNTITGTTPAHIAGTVSIVITGSGGAGTLTNAFTYYPTPAPTSVTPDQGGTGGGTSVTIAGSGFTGATGATFGGTPVTNFVVVNDTTITATTPAHAAGAVNVVVTNPIASGTLTNGFTYFSAPAPISVSPNAGITSGGTSVTISGTGFTGATSVTFGGTPATGVSVVNDTTITATTPAHAAGAVNVVVSNPVTSGTLVNGFTYFPTPVPASVSPDMGATAGGTSVTISGTGFTGATNVTFGGTPATDVIVVNDTTITATTPAHAAGAVNVVVTNPAASGTLVNGFTYFPTPAPTSVSPNQGLTAGGTSVTISGTGFTGATSVTFGGTPATGVNVVNDTTITATTPAHAAGTVDVVVANPVASGKIVGGFTYFDTPAPTSVSPNQGLTGGGTSVTINGSGFTGATAVTFGGTPATGVIVVNDTTITATTPAHAAGSVDVVVTNPVASGTLTNGFTYFDTPAPTKITPTSGPAAGGTPVTIQGSGFTGATSATLGGVPITNFTVVNDNAITGDSGAHAAATVDVVVNNPVASGTLPAAYKYT